MVRVFIYLTLAVALVAAYWFLVRPLLKARPELKELYEVEGSWLAALLLKLESIKTKLLAVLLVIASGLVEAHDFLLPLATGIDMTPITSMVPSWAWPIVSMAVAALFFWLRKITAQAQDKKLVAVEEGVITASEAITGSNPDADAEVRAMPAPTPVSAERE
jgi:hypothetical protein